MGIFILCMRERERDLHGADLLGLNYLFHPIHMNLLGINTQLEATTFAYFLNLETGEVFEVEN